MSLRAFVWKTEKKKPGAVVVVTGPGLSHTLEHERESLRTAAYYNSEQPGEKRGAGGVQELFQK
jgi:hypothetical protein